MELIQYWQIIWKRGWIIAFLVIATALLSVDWGPKPPTTYAARMRITVGLTPEDRGPMTYTYDGYYTWLTSEYIVDSFSEVVKSQAFAQDVSTRLDGGEPPLIVPAGVIQGSTVSEQVHRILTITISWHDPEELSRIAGAALAALREEYPKYFAQLGTPQGAIYVIDEPAITAVGKGWRERLDLPIRLILALLAGVGLAFLLNYLDFSIRDEEELENLGIPVLGKIPPLPGRRRFPWQRPLP